MQTLKTMRDGGRERDADKGQATRLTDLFTIFTSHRPFLLHDGLLLKFAVVGHVGDNFAVLLDSQSLRIIRHLGELAFCLLEFGVILHVALNLRVLRDTFQFRRLRHRGGFRLWYVPGEQNERLIIILVADRDVSTLGTY